jgi:hypothetical protein
MTTKRDPTRGPGSGRRPRVVPRSLRPPQTPGHQRRHRPRVSRGDRCPWPLTERSVWSYKVALRLATASWEARARSRTVPARSAGPCECGHVPGRPGRRCLFQDRPESFVTPAGARGRHWGYGLWAWRCGSSASLARRCRFSSFAPTPTTRHSERRPRAPGDGVGTDRLRVLGGRTAVKASPTTLRDGSVTRHVSDVMAKAR